MVAREQSWMPIAALSQGRAGKAGNAKLNLMALILLVEGSHGVS